MSSEKNASLDFKLTKQPTDLEKFMTNQKLVEEQESVWEKTKLHIEDVRGSLPKINVMNTQLKTTEVDTKEYNLNSNKPNEVIAIKKYNVNNFYNQIVSNIVIGAKAIFLVCRDLVHASKTLTQEDFEVLCETLPLSESTISKYMKIGQDTTVKELFTLNKLPESWTTMYKISRVKFANEDEKSALVDFVDTKTTAEDIDVFLYGAKEKLAPIWKYENLDKPKDFLKVGIESNAKVASVDPNTLEMIKQRVEKVVNDTLEEMMKVDYKINSKPMPTKAEVIINKNVFDTAEKKVREYFSDLKSEKMMKKFDDFYNSISNRVGKMISL